MKSQRDQRLKRASLLLALVVLVACGGGGGGSGSSTPEQSTGGNDNGSGSDNGNGSGSTGGAIDDGDDDENLVPDPEAPTGDPKAVTFATGLELPWGLAFLPDGSMLVTERPGRLRHVSANGRRVSEPITGLPTIEPLGQGGLLDVALDPDFKTNRRIYLSFAERSDTLAGTAVARGVLSDDNATLSEVRIIFRQLPKLERDFHFGGRMAFDENKRLFVTLGEMGEAEGAQTTDNLYGKVVRLTRAGDPAAGNPYADSPGADPRVWSLGHRNPQGAAINPDTGELWINEHGPQGGDEVNIPRAGRNYGWPRISHGCDYGTPPDTCTPFGGATSGPGFQQPITQWTPAVAPSGMAFYTGSKFPEWKGNLFVGALKGQALLRLTLDGNKVTRREALFEDLGERIRDVRQGPDGWLYLLTDNAANGRIIRIER